MGNDEAAYQELLALGRRQGIAIKSVGGNDEAIRSILNERESDQEIKKAQAHAKIVADGKILDNCLLNNTISSAMLSASIAIGLAVGGTMLAAGSEKDKEIGKSILISSIGFAAARHSIRSLRSFLESSSSSSEKT